MNTTRAQKRSMRIFWDTTCELLEWMQERFPNCQSCKDYHLMIRNVVLTNENKKLENVNEWYTNMCRPLENAKYRKALERWFADNTGAGSPCMTHAVFYHDIDAFSNCCQQSDMCVQLRVEEKYRATTMEESDRQLFWSCLESMTRAAFEVMQIPLPSQPSREDLAKYIRLKKSSNDKKTSHDTGTVQRALQVAINALLESRSCDVRITDSQVHAWRKRWVSISHTQTASGADMLQAISSTPDECTEHLQQGFPEIDWNTPLSSTDTKLISQIMSMARVDDSVPSSVMTAIEGVANKLAEDLVKGDKSLDSLSINDIAKQLSGKISERDLETLSGSMSSMLPALQALQRDL